MMRPEGADKRQYTPSTLPWSGPGVFPQMFLKPFLYAPEGLQKQLRYVTTQLLKKGYAEVAFSI